jgi:uncharacterized lipoprotein YmbA
MLISHLALLGGCFSLDPKEDPTRFYTLAPLGEESEVSTNLRVVVSKFPYYLQSRKIALRSSQFEVSYEDFHQWAGPLDVMLEDRLEKSLQAKGLVGQLLEVAIIRFEGTGEGDVKLVAEWAYSSGQGVAKQGFFRSNRAWADGDTITALVAALGELVDELGVEIFEACEAES